jgi:hypothetical protein
MIWGALHGRGVREDDPAAWPPFAHIDRLGGGGPFAAAGMSAALVGAYDELIGPGRWTPQVYADGAVAVRFPSGDRANAGHQNEGSYDGPHSAPRMIAQPAVHVRDGFVLDGV